MPPKCDGGGILAQASLPITPADTRETLYTKLFDLGANTLVKTLPLITSGQIEPHSQTPGKYFYARQITRQDGFIPYDQFTSQLTTHNLPAGRQDSQLLTKFRAFFGWP